MFTSPRLLFLTCLCFFQLIAEATGTSCPPPHPDAIVPATEKVRLALIGRARIWMDDHRGDRTLLEGPWQEKSENRFSLKQLIRCRFIEPQEMSRPGGTTEKFTCRHQGRTLRVRYHSSREYNPGIWGELLSTRLFWALGLPADAVYPVKVICEGCPDAPWLYIYEYFRTKYPEQVLAKAVSANHRSRLEAELVRANQYVETHLDRRGTQLIEDAQVEIQYPAATIERCKDQGWNWAGEFNHIAEADADSRRQLNIERDAFALLAAFIQHADNKPEQQRLICATPSGAGDNCSNPVLMIHDLGFTFGGGWERPTSGAQRDRKHPGVYSSINLARFLAAPLWRDADQCITKVRYIPTGTEISRRVSEQGRKFLAEKLERLISSKQDLLDLFTAAGVERRPVQVRNLQGKIYKNSYSTEEWAEAFKKRAQTIIDHRCPPLENTAR